MKTLGTGVVFDIQRFALNDGPGIRTTVFLKGCPMRCLWCHNPESQSFKPQLSFNPDKCINCFECVKVCPSGTHMNVNGKHEVNFDLCSLSGECVKVCTQGALKIIGHESQIDSIISEVIRDMHYYDNSGGGLTISGGEPLSQFEFTKELLIAAREAGIHTCVDTCGFAKQTHYEQILPYTDLFLFDYKATETSVHKQLTGTDNELVLNNLEFLYNRGAQIILRCPLIPGVNDSEEHLKGIASLAVEYPLLREIKLLPYHNFGRDKAARIGEEYKLNHVEVPTDEQKQNWLAVINRAIADINVPILID